MIRQVLSTAARATVARWRASLAVLVIIGVPLALPFVALQLVDGLVFSGSGDPVLRQHALWLVGNPETTSLIFGVWLLLFGPWAIGIWGAGEGNRLRLWIGWEVYVRYLVVICCAAVVTVLDGVLIGLLDLAFELSLILEVVTDCAALYVLFRLAPTGPAIRAGAILDLPGAWRATASEAGRILGLAVLWILLGLVISVVAQIVSRWLSVVLGTVDMGRSYVELLILIGAPGLITGLAAAFIGLVSIALFWAVAERTAPQP